MGGSSEEKGRPIPCNCYKIDCYEIFNQTIVGPVSFFFLIKKNHTLTNFFMKTSENLNYACSS